MFGETVANRLGMRSPPVQQRIISPQRGHQGNNQPLKGTPMLGNANHRVLGNRTPNNPIRAVGRQNNQTLPSSSHKYSLNKDKANFSPPTRPTEIYIQNHIQKKNHELKPAQINNVRIIESVQIPPQSPHRSEEFIISESPVINRPGSEFLSNVEFISSPQVSRPQSLPHSPVQPFSTPHEEYIIQLLSESKEMKIIVERLINDNNTLIKQNHKLQVLKDNREELDELRKLLDHYFQQNTELKQKIEQLQSSPRLDDDSELEQCNRIIKVLERQVTVINKMDDKRADLNPASANNPEEKTSTLILKQKQITLLQQENNYLSQQLRSLLTEIHSVQSRFQEEKLSLIEENESFRSAANEQINRLRLIISKIEEERETLELKHSSPATQSQSPAWRSSVEQKTTILLSADTDPRVKISGGYEDFTKTREFSPAKVRVTTTQIVDGVRTVSVQDTTQYLQFLEEKNPHS